jgi:hypothetical protein
VRENGSDREYRFRELTYDVVPASAVMEQDFSPDVSLRISRAALFPDIGAPNIGHVVIAALKLVDQLTYEFGDQLDVTRTEDGKVEISGVLQSKIAVAAVKQEAGSLLASGLLSVSLHSRDETPARRSEGFGRFDDFCTSKLLTTQRFPWMRSCGQPSQPWE